MCDAEWREKIEKKLDDIAAGIDMLIATDNARNKRAINNRGSLADAKKQIGELLLGNPLIANNPALKEKAEQLLSSAKEK